MQVDFTASSFSVQEPLIQ